MDAFTRQTAIRYIVPMHEQAAGFMAEGYAKASGKIGFAMATSGPGGGNLVVPIQNCFYDSTPCIFITGQVASGFCRPYGSPLRQLGFQETPIVDITRPITKWSTQITVADEAAWIMEKAIKKCISGRPGPVLIDICIDIQKCSVKPLV